MSTGILHFIYALLDGSDLAPRYVGRTGDLKLREWFHRNPSVTHKQTPAMVWTRANRDTFIMQYLEIVDKKDAHIRETEWITRFRSLGYDLLNILPPVDPEYYFKRSREYSARIAARRGEM